MAVNQVINPEIVKQIQPKLKEIKAQPGPQEAFLSCRADVALYGGAAGGGKSFALLMDPLRNINNPFFAAVFFRKTKEDIRKPGAIWQTSYRIYNFIKGVPREHVLDWKFPSGAYIKFDGLENENSVQTYQGAQIPWIGFDELTHFSKAQFIYLLGRNRSADGIPSRVRATCNPDADSWLRKFIDWWIDPQTGFAIPERSGVIRWFYVIEGDKEAWGDSKEELMQKYPELAIDPETGDEVPPLSFTFIPASLGDNKILTKSDPKYRSALMSQTLVNRERLLKGNWNIKPTAGLVFNRSWFEVVRESPKHPYKRIIRYWDRASTKYVEGENDPDWTRGLLVSYWEGIFYVENLASCRESPFNVQKMVKNIASQDGVEVEVWLEEDPAQAGKSDIDNYIRALAGFNVNANKVTKNKLLRAEIASRQAEAGNIKLVRRSSADDDWIDAFLTEVHAFTGEKDNVDDIVDTLSGSVNVLTEENVGEFTDKMVKINQERKNYKEKKLW